MADRRDDPIAAGMDELRQFVARHRGAKPRPGSRLYQQLDTARRVVASYDRASKSQPVTGARR